MRMSDKNGRWPIPRPPGDHPDPHLTHVEPDPILRGHPSSDDHGINLPVRIKRGWWFIIAVVAALALAVGFLVLGAATAEASTPQAVVSSQAMVSSVEEGCQGMDAVEATERFSHLDGSPSDLSEWTPTETSLIHRGPRVKGKMPYGFMAYGNFAKRDRHYVLAGTQLRGKRFEITCTPDIGASYVRIIPTTCPKNLEIANRRYGGKWIEGPVPPFSGIRNILGFSKNSPRWALGSFTVPHQAIVTVMEHEGQFDTYFPGDIVPPSYRLQLTCYI